MTSSGQHILPFTLGITGTIGSGKSLVGKLLEEENVPVLDSDKVVHLLLDSDRAVIDAIEKRFGRSVLLERAQALPVVNRAALGECVFNDEEARKDLEGIVHPATIAYCQNWSNSQAAELVALLVPLLFEAGQSKRYNEIWTVTCDPALLRERLQARNGFTDAEMDKRLAAQLSQQEKAARADRVIDNSGTIEATRQQVRECLAAWHEKSTKLTRQ